MTTIQEDQKVFSMSDDKNLSEEDTQNIKNTIAEMSKSRNEAAEEFFDDLLDGKIK
jgi:hypothetical protein